MGSSTPRPPRHITGKCPICGAPSEYEARPFCSRRCADVDLSRWLRGGYAIAGGQADADEDGEDAAIGRRGGADGAEDREGQTDEDV